MDKKKLIGTIVGVILFIIIIAGATFAWLTYSANIYNGVYNTSTKNFLVNYTGGSNISSLPMLSGIVTHSSYTGASGSITTIQASKRDVDGTLYLKLHTNNDADSNALANADCIRYAVCVGTECSGASSSDLSEVASSYGIISSSGIDSDNDFVIYTGSLGATSTNYNIYLWIDNGLVTSSEVGLTYTGYIHAFAIQDDPNGV